MEIINTKTTTTNGFQKFFATRLISELSPIAASDAVNRYVYTNLTLAIAPYESPA